MITENIGILRMEGPLSAQVRVRRGIKIADLRKINCLQSKFPQSFPSINIGFRGTCNTTSSKF